MISALALATVACGDDDGSTSTTSTSASSSSGAGGMGSGGMGSGGMGSGGDGTGGMGETPVNGCTLATAVDMTGMATVDLTWTLPHASCIIVDLDTTVNWNGDFGAHPLAGGVTPTSDDTSAITMSDQTTMTASVTFTAAGDYPYFCTVHTAGMEGVIYVE